MKDSSFVVFSIIVLLLAYVVLFAPLKNDNVLTGFAFSSLYSGYAVPIGGIIVDSNLNFVSSADTISRTIDVSDDIVYRRAYISLDGQAWSQFNLTPTSTLSGEWIYGRGISNILFSPSILHLNNSRNFTNNTYIIIYSCSKNITIHNWSCHDGWQIIPFNARMNSVNSGSKVVIYAAGRAGDDGIYPIMELWINNVMVTSWNVTGDVFVPTYGVYNYTYSNVIDNRTLVRVNYPNDVYGTTRDLRVDKILIDGKAYESESASNINTGMWDGTNCGGVSYSGSEWLNCTGYIQYNLSSGFTPISCISQYSSSCYNGNVYWYNSCGAREGIKTTCTSTQTCPSTVCVNNPTGKPIKIFIIGDSTAAIHIPTSSDTSVGWAMELQQFFNSQYVTVVDNAVGGASSMSYLTTTGTNSWATTNQTMSAGDYLFIQFGHNDEPSLDPGSHPYPTDPNTTYKQYLKVYIDAARAKNVNPVLLTPVERNQWSGSVLTQSHDGYPAAMIALAQQQNVPLIDMTNRTRTLYYSIYNSLGLTYLTNNYFSDGVTHFTLLGANETAKLVIQGIQELGNSTILVQYIIGSTPLCTGTQPSTSCSIANGVGTRSATCSGGTWNTGTCTVASCNTNYGSCDGNAANGCEADLTTANNCGTCGNVCASGTCSGGQCTTTGGGTGRGTTGACGVGYNCGTLSGVNCGNCTGGLTCNANNLCVSASGKTLYVDFNGNDNTGDGSITKPWATWQKGIDALSAGDILYLRGGTYSPTGISSGGPTVGVRINSKTGTSSNPINIYAYPGEKPILDCTHITQAGWKVGLFITNSNYIYLKGLTIQNLNEQGEKNQPADGCVYDTDTHITFEGCTVTRCGYGFRENGASCDYISFINCDAYDNGDTTFGAVSSGGAGGYADGFGIHTAGQNGHFSFTGCRAWDNSDDGWDLINSGDNIVLSNCWSFQNGHTLGDWTQVMGDGCGFKIGGQEIGTAIGGVQRTLYNCISAYNSLTGFDANYGSVRLDNSLYNCISYNDITSGYHFVQPGAVSTLKNCVEYSTYNSRVYEGVSSNIEDHNSWDSNLGVTVDNNDFVNTDYTQLAGQRKADGSLPDITFLHLAANSDLINKGTPISGRTSDGYGQTIFGNPDLGAFEHP